MKYFFILGNNPALSIAEISAVFSLGDNSKVEFLGQEVFLLETENNFNPAELIKKLGGVIKIGAISNELNFDNQKIVTESEKLITIDYEGKIKFGVSFYGHNKFNLKIVGMEIKKRLREKNISVRWVVSREKVLSSVVVEQNKLISQGAEIVLIQKDNHVLMGKTLAVQPFKELSFRDFGRPARDDFSGMLPPKLAQIMINLSGAKNDDTILDPFCGSGTILTEAMLMGCKNLIGFDISPKAIEDTKKNIEWIKNKFNIQHSTFNIQIKDATALSESLKPSSINAIVTEPYLGPQRGKKNIGEIITELEKLYSNSLAEFKKILKPGGRIIMIWPVFHVSQATHSIRPNINGFKIINPIPENLRQSKKISLTERNTIIYGREQQKVWREIIILEK
ncbi:MAG: DNA methyltransferase [Patescibacteria group bacterium]